MPDRLAQLAAALAERYTIERELGRGGNATVYLAHDRKHRRQVALKVLLPELALSVRTERFLREIEIAAHLSHPHILPMHDSGEADGCLYYVMPYAEGESLRERLQREKHFSLQDGLRIAREVASALNYAHQQGVVHRDIKPANILLQAGMAVVADFGIARALSAPSGQTLTETGVQVGTPMYMSPEQAASESVGPPSDVYSLGMVVYELLTGTLPFEATSSMGWAAAHLRDTPLAISQRRPDLSPEVARLIDCCLAKRPEDRPSAREVAEGMLPSPETEVQWPPPGLRSLFGSARKLTRFALTAAVGILLLLLALAFPPVGVRTGADWWSHYATAQQVTGSLLGVRSEASDATRAHIPEWWPAALALGFVATGVGFFGLVLSSYGVVAMASRKRAQGWRRNTLVDVVADPDGRSGLLLVGFGSLASIPPPQRREILSARRMLFWLRVAAGVWAPAVFGLWATLVVAGGWSLSGAGAVAGPTVYLLALVPSVIVLASSLAVARREAQLLGPLARRRRYGGAFGGADADASPAEIAAWYSTLPDRTAPTPPRAASGIPTIGAAHVIAGLAGVVALATLGLIAGAAVVAGRNAVRLGPETAELVATLGRLDVDDPLAVARQAWRSYLPEQSAVSESVSLAWVRALLESAQRDQAAPVYPFSPTQLLGPVGSPAPTSLRLGNRAVGQRLPDNTARLMQALADHPRTALFRRLARAPRLDLFGAELDRPLSRYETLAAVPEPPYGALREAAQANLLGALLAASRRDFIGASQRLGENAALAEQFLLVPRLFSARFGVGMLQDLALLPLAENEEAQGNKAKAGELREAAARLRGHVYSRAWATRMTGLAADPGELGRLVAALRDERLPSGLRAESFYGGFAGFCLNPREILSGLSPGRGVTVLGAVDSMPEVPYASQLAELTSRDWQIGALASAPGLPRGVASLAAWPSGPVLVRLVTCATQLR